MKYNKRKALEGAALRSNCMLFSPSFFWNVLIQTVYRELAMTPEKAKKTPADVVVSTPELCPA